MSAELSMSLKAAMSDGFDPEECRMDMIRPAAIQDAFRLAEIEIVNYRMFFYPIFRTERYFFSELSVPVLAQEYSAEPERIAHTTVYDDGVVKGFIRVCGNEIEKLFVEPAFQGNGIGNTLLRYATMQLGANRLQVLEKNVRAIRFYQRNGFCLTEQKQRVDDTSEFLIWMDR